MNKPQAKTKASAIHDALTQVEIVTHELANEIETHIQGHSHAWLETKDGESWEEALGLVQNAHADLERICAELENFFES